jgi:alkanesulfonate monooxygenase SsuD/methylene tetrahydromethanopterin reductase-like flavin-dependent oxidoreductase (luciferase family)
VQAHLPLLVGGGGERVTLRIAARWADEWNTWGTPDHLAAKAQVLDRHCEAVGRDPKEITRSAQVIVYLDARGQQVDRPMPKVSGSVAQLQDLMGAYLEAGVGEFILPDWNLGTGSARRELMDRFLTEVAAPFRRS